MRLSLLSTLAAVTVGVGRVDGLWMPRGVDYCEVLYQLAMRRQAWAAC